MVCNVRYIIAVMFTILIFAFVYLQAQSRGYVTTPQELQLVKQKAGQGIEPYHSAVNDIMQYATESLEPFQAPDETCSRKDEYYRNSYRMLAKSIVFHLTGDETYADEVVNGIKDATNHPSSRRPTQKSDQCNLNAAWYIQGIIQAADLLEGYSGWTLADKKAFQEYLAESVYPFAEAASHRANNWGSGGACASTYIADYLWDRPDLTLRGLDGIDHTPAEVYELYIQNQIARINGTDPYDGGSTCSFTGIRPDGGIPLELERGSTGCDGLWIKEQDASWTYTMTTLETLILHSELLWRRGDSRIYDYIYTTGSGSLLKAVFFIIDNPNDPTKSLDWKESHKHALELVYRYYHATQVGNQLRVNSGSQRYIGGKCGQALHYGTITHGFALNENPGPPPTVTPPGGGNINIPSSPRNLRIEK